MLSAPYRRGRAGAAHKGEGVRSLQLAMPPWDHNPFVLVNYSPTICLNPSPLMRMESWPILVGQEKRYDGGSVQSHVQIGSAAVRRDPAHGAWPHSRRAAA